MRRWHDQTGSTLIMVVCLAAALFVMSGTLVLVTSNTQGRTLATRSKDKSLNVAEAAMESTVYNLGNSWPTESSPSPTRPRSATILASSPPGMPTPVGRVRGALVERLPQAVLDGRQQQQSGAGHDQVLDRGAGSVGGQQSAIQCVVQQHSTGVTTVVPGIALYAGGNVAMTVLR